MGEPVFLVVGTLKRSHGIRGDVVMEVHTDFPERLASGKTVFIGEEHRPLKITNIRQANKDLLIRFEGYTNPESTGDLRNQVVFVLTKDIPSLPDGEYYHHQLIGLRVVTDSGHQIGTLTEILETGANDVYVITPAEGEEILIPAVSDFILGIDLAAREIKVAPPEWG